MAKRTMQCRNCKHYKKCLIKWGSDCTENGGRRIPRFKKSNKSWYEPDELVAVVIWQDGTHEHFMRHDLEPKTARTARNQMVSSR